MSKTAPIIRIVFVALSLATVYGQRIEETSATLTFNGTWTAATDPNASGGAYTTSSTAGSSVTFQTTGKNFVIYRKVDTSGGKATVTVDGANYGSILFYFQEARWQVPAAIDNLPDGPHTVVLTVSADQPTGSTGNNVYLDALENPGSPNLGPTPAQSDAITRTNFHRSLMGIPPARHNLALGLAADAHAKYLSNVDFISNGVSPHVETYGADPSFTGVNPSDRDSLFGVTNFGGVEDSNNAPDPIQFVDGWMDGVYHRSPYTNYGLTEAGFGGYSKGSTMDFGSNLTQVVRPSATTYAVYPSDGQTDVWTSYDGGDGPSNVTPGNAYGFPISLSVSYAANVTAGTAAATATTGTLTDAAGNQIPVTIADSSNDRQVSGYFMIPNQALNPSTTYTARMTGVDNSIAFDKKWSFTTANPNSVHALRAVLGAKTYMYSINWEMPGAGATAQVEYGPTTAYGTVVPAVLSSGSQTAYRTSIAGLLATPVTHFRVTAKDAQGNAYATVDHTINTANTLAPATVGFISVNPDPADTGFQWETAGPVASTQINMGLDTTYGTTVTSSVYGGYTTWFYADAFDLVSGTTYHYQIVATDLNGNTFTSPDATFTIP